MQLEFKILTLYLTLQRVPLLMFVHISQEGIQIKSHGNAERIMALTKMWPEDE